MVGVGSASVLPCITPDRISAADSSRASVETFPFVRADSAETRRNKQFSECVLLKVNRDGLVDIRT